MKKPLLSLFVLSAAMAAGPVAAADPACPACFQQRYVYFSANFDYIEYVDALKALIPRAKAAGYNGIALNSGGSGSFIALTQPSKPSVESRYREIAALAAQYDMEIIPVGANPSVAATMDPTLVEAFPVQGQTFTAANASAAVAPVEILTNAGFEIATSPTQVQDWLLLDASAIAWDGTVGHSGTASIRFSPASSNNMARLYRPLDNLKPYTAYRLSFWIKTNNYNGNLRVQIYDGAGKQPLFFNVSSGLGWGVDAVTGNKNAQPNNLATTQEWQPYNLDFNTLGNTSIRLYLGTWANSSLNGNAWADDFSLKEVGLARTVRRSSLPITVTSENGATTYTEGADYQVATERLLIPNGASRIHAGDKLKVSWWQSSSGVESNYGAPASICSTAYYDKQKSVAQKVDDVFHAGKFFIYFDEWRAANWDPACGSLTAAQYFGQAMTSTVSALRTVQPAYQFFTWNDMFDPYHNAKSAYWMVKGSLVGSGSFLPLDTTVMNWNMQGDTPALAIANATNSLTYFSTLGVKQVMAMYYDDTSLANINNWLTSLNQAESAGATGINGVMYTTWAGNAGYANLEAVAQRIKNLAPSRWPTTDVIH